MRPTTIPRPTPQRIVKARVVSVHAAQLEFLQATETFRGFVGGRGAGKSFIGAYDLLKRAKTRKLYMVVSPTVPILKDTTLPAFREACRLAGRGEKIRESDFRGFFQCNDGTWASIVFRGAEKPDSLRGPNIAGVWLDEASYLKSAVWDVVIACLRDGGQMGWLSATFTPKGKKHWTYRVFGQGKHRLVQCRTADNPFLPEEYEETIAGEYTAERRKQELEGEFIDPEGQLIQYGDMVECSDDCLWTNPPERAETYIGVDVGRTKDLTCVWTWEKVGDVLATREVLTIKGQSFAEQKQQIKARLRRRGTVKCQIDKGGIGYQLAEELEKEHLGVVEGVHLSGGNMAVLANQLAVEVEARRVRIPADETIYDDWAMVPKPETRSGKDWLPSVDRDPDLGHADRFWAAALGLDAARHAVKRPRIAAPVARGRR